MAKDSKYPDYQGPNGSPFAGSGTQPEPVILLHGQRLHAMTMAQCVRHILAELDAGRGGWVATPNVDHLRRLRRDRIFAALCADANLVLADGMPLVWASRLQGTPLPERVSGSDLFWSLSAGAAERGHPIFLLGGAPGTAEAAAKVLKSHYPKLHIAGTHYPEMGFESDEKALANLERALCSAKPDIVYVALGSPKQEIIIARLRGRLPGSWWIPVGICFSFVSGEIHRAPKWMRRAGLEWLHRLAQEPRRLAKRYLVYDIPFAISLLSDATLHRLFKTGERQEDKER